MGSSGCLAIVKKEHMWYLYDCVCAKYGFFADRTKRERGNAGVRLQDPREQ